MVTSMHRIFRPAQTLLTIQVSAPAKALGVPVSVHAFDEVTSKAVLCLKPVVTDWAALKITNPSKGFLKRRLDWWLTGL